jgi:hypothetical protein
MNAFLTMVLLSISFVAAAQKSTNSNLNTSIQDNGKTLSIQVDGQREGQTINYQRTFDVAKLSTTEKDALRKRILDSLDVGVPESPSPPTAPILPGGTATTSAQPVTFQCTTCEGRIKLSVVSASENYAYEQATKIDSEKPFFPHQLTVPPGEYKLKYYQNGVLQIQSTFTVKEGEKSTVVVK